LWPTAFGNVFQQQSTPLTGPFQSLATDAQWNLYVMIVDSAGTVWETQRSNPSWTNFAALPSGSTTFVTVRCAFDSSGNLHALAIDSTWNVWHAMKNVPAGGDWSPGWTIVPTTGLPLEGVSSKYLIRFGTHCFPGIAKLGCVANPAGGIYLAVLDGDGRLRVQSWTTNGWGQTYVMPVNATGKPADLGALSEVDCSIDGFGNLMIFVTDEAGQVSSWCFVPKLQEWLLNPFGAASPVFALATAYDSPVIRTSAQARVLPRQLRMI
jgi:hypothetical protein